MSENYSIKVIIADDHEIYVGGLKAFFNDQDVYEVVDEAYNGEELVRKVKTHLPHIVITDLRMPILSGARAVEEIKRISPPTHCLVLSSYDNDLSIIEALQAGANGYITKNMPQKDLFTALDQLIKGYPYFCLTTNTKMLRLLSKSSFNPYATAPNPQFTDIELKIIRMICEEKTNPEMAFDLCLSIRTIENNRARVYEKLNVRSPAGVVIYAIRNGLYNPD
ncbi:MAG: response regulator transcription factor [Sediminibacterium magnilacihabitans]|jgi:DNA-binding NarL/FixJ family response regulator|nr:response regulator transcription factor [Sediminibacterium magnilacihabitans]PQV60428.1 LuxR family two component transcriptional regulator [Sediminibacterium magnilacihabitans]